MHCIKKVVKNQRGLALWAKIVLIASAIAAVFVIPMVIWLLVYDYKNIDTQRERDYYNALMNAADNVVTVRYYTDSDLSTLRYVRFIDAQNERPELSGEDKSGYSFVGYYSLPDGSGIQYIDADGKWLSTPQQELLLYPYYVPAEGEQP